MQTTGLLERDLVKSISTKFQFGEDNKMTYQIVLHYGAENLHLYKNFDNFDEYQQYHDTLVESLNNLNAQIPNDFMTFG